MNIITEQLGSTPRYIYEQNWPIAENKSTVFITLKTVNYKLSLLFSIISGLFLCNTVLKINYWKQFFFIMLLKGTPSVGTLMLRFKNMYHILGSNTMKLCYSRQQKTVKVPKICLHLLLSEQSISLLLTVPTYLCMGKLIYFYTSAYYFRDTFFMLHFTHIFNILVICCSIVKLILIHNY